MAQFVHPSKNDITLAGILSALSDPLRLKILKCLLASEGCMSCSEAAAPWPDIPKSTLSHHFRVLREAGLIHTEKRGVEHQNTVRWAEVNSRFPGLLKKIIEQCDETVASARGR